MILSEPRKMIALANGFAIASLPKVIEMLEDGYPEPIWNLPDSLDGILRENQAAYDQSKMGVGI